MPVRLAIFALAALLLMITGCQPAERPAADAERGELVIYAGRNENLVGPVVERFRQQTGINVRVRYGRDAELLAALQEEGQRSPADLFWANTAGALGAASNANLLAPLSDDLLRQPAAFVPSGGLWVPATVRFRVLAYSAQRVDAGTLPASVMDLPGMGNLRGRIGWTPTYSSFQDFVTALRITRGDEAARQWLQQMQALQPRTYASNTPMLEALAAGEIDVALTNHYYVLRITRGDDTNLAMHHFAEGDVGNLALVTGAGVLNTAGNRLSAQRFLEFLLSAEEQRQTAETAQEYPVIEGVEMPARLMPFDRALRLSPDLDLERLRELEETLAMMRRAELL
jgi:iron(III) transport system substrate-binding protein